MMNRFGAECRFIVDPPGDGPWNMGADEYLLRNGSTDRRPTLRLYRWSEPTLSLGYFQSAADRTMHPSSSQCPVVRRATGGGAILHDWEVTYSLTVPTSARWSTEAGSLYRIVHQSVAEYLRRFGVSSALYAATEPVANRGAEPFLCFQRRSTGDLICGPHKIVGSAQRRREGTILQHGSILLGRSDYAPELAGLREVDSPERPARASNHAFYANFCDPDCWMTEWPQWLADTVGWRLLPIDWSQSERLEIETGDKKKFEGAGWTHRR